jgi:hypothetical protein
MWYINSNTGFWDSFWKSFWISFCIGAILSRNNQNNVTTQNYHIPEKTLPRN